MLTYTIIEKDHCRRVESFLQNLLTAAPLSYVRKVLKSGSVAVNGQQATPDSVLHLDDIVTMKESGRLRQLLNAQKPLLDVVFEDQWIIVFNKRPGLAVHRTAEVDERNLVELGESFLRRREGIPPNSPLKLRPVNRIDRGTSGAIILAKSPTAAGMFGRMIKEEGLGKIYLAVASGVMPAEGAITAPLEGKEAETRFRVLHQGKKAALVAVIPITGRMHQIRQHFKAAGHPILGDRRYGGAPIPGYDGHALHSFLTTFTHPATGLFQAVFAPLPDGLLRVVQNLTTDSYAEIVQSLATLLGEFGKAPSAP